MTHLGEDFSKQSSYLITQQAFCLQLARLKIYFFLSHSLKDEVYVCDIGVC